MVPLQPKPIGKAPGGTQEAAALRHQSLDTSVSDIFPEKYHRVQMAWLGVRIQFQVRNFKLPPKALCLSSRSPLDGTLGPQNNFPISRNKTIATEPRPISHFLEKHCVSL